MWWALAPGELDPAFDLNVGATPPSGTSLTRDVLHDDIDFVTPVMEEDVLQSRCAPSIWATLLRQSAHCCHDALLERRDPRCVYLT